MKKIIYLVSLLCISSFVLAQSNKVGINTTNPVSTLHVKSTENISPFLVQQGDSSKLQTFANGGTSIGSSRIAPKNGLYVKGTLEPDSGIVTTQKLVIESIQNSITLKVGGSTIVIQQNGDIDIDMTNPFSNFNLTSKGNVNIKGQQLILSGHNVQINSENQLDLHAGIELNLVSEIDMNLDAVNRLDLYAQTVLHMQAMGISELKGAILKLNGGGSPAAKLGSSISGTSGGPGTGVVGMVNGNVSTSVLIP